LPDRDSRRLRARPAGDHGTQGNPGAGRTRPLRTRHRRRPGRVRRADACRADRARGAEPAAVPVRAGPPASEVEAPHELEAGSARRAAREGTPRPSAGRVEERGDPRAWARRGARGRRAAADTGSGMTLVLVEHAGGEPDELSLQALAFA